MPMMQRFEHFLSALGRDAEGLRADGSGGWLEDADHRIEVRWPEAEDALWLTADLLRLPAEPRVRLRCLEAVMLLQLAHAEEGALSVRPGEPEPDEIILSRTVDGASLTTQADFNEAIERFIALADELQDIFMVDVLVRGAEA